MTPPSGNSFNLGGFRCTQFTPFSSYQSFQPESNNQLVRYGGQFQGPPANNGNGNKYTTTMRRHELDTLLEEYEGECTYFAAFPVLTGHFDDDDDDTADARHHGWNLPRDSLMRENILKASTIFIHRPDKLKDCLRLRRDSTAFACFQPFLAAPRDMGDEAKPCDTAASQPAVEDEGTPLTSSGYRATSPNEGAFSTSLRARNASKDLAGMGQLLETENGRTADTAEQVNITKVNYSCEHNEIEADARQRLRHGGDRVPPWSTTTSRPRRRTEDHHHQPKSDSQFPQPNILSCGLRKSTRSTLKHRASTLFGKAKTIAGLKFPQPQGPKASLPLHPLSTSGMISEAFGSITADLDGDILQLPRYGLDVPRGRSQACTPEDHMTIDCGFPAGGVATHISFTPPCRNLTTLTQFLRLSEGASVNQNSVELPPLRYKDPVEALRVGYDDSGEAI
ncbi:hypothetical protein HDK90DRAFT_515800 [Phyllosticta capitalensis]|uniref:Uncharacterized protein n=1 Tax=Phyllosticta capitalensis TaxID=121624 RepID=A0ABR1Y907_9PEZI